MPMGSPTVYSVPFSIDDIRPSGNPLPHPGIALPNVPFSDLPLNRTGLVGDSLSPCFGGPGGEL